MTSDQFNPAITPIDESMRVVILQLMERRKRQEPYRRSTAPGMLLRERIHEIVAVTLDQYDHARSGLRIRESHEETLERIGKRVSGFTSFMQPFHPDLYFSQTLKSITAQVIHEIELYRECFPEASFHFMRLPWMDEQP